MGRRVPNADVYQLLAYVALDLPGGMLVYAEGEAERRRTGSGTPERWRSRRSICPGRSTTCSAESTTLRAG